MARFVQHEPCPKCGSRDNLGRYDDGGATCFGCGYYEPPTHAPPRRMAEETHEETSIPKMPDDTGNSFSEAAVAWLSQYYVSVPDAIQAGFRWSESRQQLIFLLEDGCWQARNFSKGGTNEAKRSKYFTAGNVNDSIRLYYHHAGVSGGIVQPREPVLLPQSTETLTIVEDCVSAYRVSTSVSDAMPVLGSHVATKKLVRLAHMYDTLVFWLDSDKLTEARKMARQAQLLGLSASVIHTELDPKCYTNEQIKEFLQ